MRIACTIALGVLCCARVMAQEPIFAPPAAVKAEGVPPVPLSLVEAVSPYGEFRQARFLAWHPQERRLLVQTSFGNVPQIHEVRGPGAARTQLTFVRDGVTGGASYDPRGRFIVFRRDTGRGTEAMQLFRQDPSGTVTLLTDGRALNGVPVWSHRGSLIAYDSTHRDGRNRDLYVMDPAQPEGARMVSQVDGAWTVYDWSPDDRELLVLEAISESSRTCLWRVEVSTGRKIPVSSCTEEAAVWTAAQYSSNGRSIYALGDRGAELQRVWRMDLGAGTWSAVTRDGDPIEAFALSPDGTRIAVVIDRDAMSRLEILDAATGKTQVTPSFPPGVISQVAWHPSSGELAVEFAGARTFRDVYSVALPSARIDRWTMSEIGGAEPASLPDAEPIRWKSFDGLSISGLLYRPAPRFTGPRPVIINVHGGPSLRERPRALGRSNYFRNEMGVAIIYPNIRGSVGFGRQFEQLDNGRGRVGAVKDIGALLDWIATQPDLDRHRVMLTGSSYGGYITLAAAIEYGDRIRCAFEGFGMSDLVTFLESTEESRRHDRTFEYGDPSDPPTRAFLTAISPLTRASELRVPLFIAQGARDTRVPLSQAEAMVAAVRANGTPLWYVVYQDAGHEEFTRATNDYNIYAWVMFVRTFLVN
jgi:dipeptidyl aminopeptidase/acylaminoacyl peptidase